jgi:hypothetical protein
VLAYIAVGPAARWTGIPADAVEGRGAGKLIHWFEDQIMNISIGPRSLVLGLMCAVVPSPQMLAGTPAPKVPDGPTVDFAKADRNGNGNISREEALLVPDLTSAFEMLDLDADNKVSPTEFARWSRAARVEVPRAGDPATMPSGSAGAQHMPRSP